MEKNEFLGFVIVIIIVGSGIGFMYLLDSLYTSNDIQPTTTIPTYECYIIAEGTFDFIDVYTMDTFDGSYLLDFQNHITMSNVKYVLPNPSTDYGDNSQNKSYKNLYRIMLWICIDGNLTDYWFPMIEKTVYEITYLNINFTIYILK